MLLMSADFKINIFKKFFQKHIRVSNAFDPDQDRYQQTTKFPQAKKPFS